MSLNLRLTPPKKPKKPEKTPEEKRLIQIAETLDKLAEKKKTEGSEQFDWYTDANKIINIKGDLGEKGLDGKDGKDGSDGTDGKDGKDGKDGINGIDGIRGKDGLNGIDGKKGDKPKHEWDDTKLRFENPDGSWGVYIDLKGEDGKGSTKGRVSGVSKDFYRLFNTPDVPDPGKFLKVGVDGSIVFSDVQQGALSFKDLIDTPVALGAAGEFVRMNAQGTELEFVIHTSPVNLSDLNDDLGVPNVLADLDNVPAIGNPGQIIQVALNGVNHEYINQPAIPVNLSDLNDDLGVPNNLADLDDVPIRGAANQMIIVSGDGTTHIYQDQPTIPTNLSELNNDLNLNIPTILSDLTDVPARGNAGQMIVVTQDGQSHEYINVQGGGIGDLQAVNNLSDVIDPTQSRENIKADFYATGETLHIGGVDKANSLLGLTSDVDHEGIALPIIAARFDAVDSRRHVFFGSNQSAIQRFSPFFNQNTHFDENDGVIIGSPNKDRIQGLFNITGSNLSYHVVQNEHRIVSNIAYGSTYLTLGTGGGTHVLNALCSNSGRGRFIIRSGIRGTFMADKYAVSVIPGVDNPYTNIYGAVSTQKLNVIDSDVPDSVFGFSIIAYLDIQNSRTVFLPKVDNVVTNSDVAAELTIIDFTGNVNPGMTITIQAFQGQSINGQASVVISGAYRSYTLIGCPGTQNWYIKSKT